MIAALELAILQQLQGAADAGVLGYRWFNLDTFPDQFEQYLQKVGNLRTPSAWAVFLGMDKGEDQGDDTGWTARCRFALVVAAQNMRNEDKSRHGNGAEPGSYQLTEDAIRILSGNDLGLHLVETITVVGARLVSRTSEMARQGLSLMAIELECRAPFGVFDQDFGEFRSLHVDWDIPPHGNVEPPLPAADPDAEDLIEVPQ